MPTRRLGIALLLLLAAACGGEEASALNPGDYFTQLARISENAHIQERGLERDRRARLEGAGTSAELHVVEIYVGQRAALYQDVVDALSDLQPDDSVQGPHDAYEAAWQAQLDLLVKVRDAGYDGVTEYLEALETPAFSEAAEARESSCLDLQAAAEHAGRQVDLACTGRAP
jgi:hypothetical protein